VSDLYDDEDPPHRAPDGGSLDGATEGVRILGAEEVRASLGEHAAAPAAPPTEAKMVFLDDDEEPQLDLREPAPRLAADEPGEQEAAVAAGRVADRMWSERADDLLPDRDPVRERSFGSSFESKLPEPPPLEAILEDPVEARLDDAPTGEVPPLPHWTEPPTGAVPAIFADESENPDELDAWATVSGAQPRFRADGADWAESDFADDLSGEQVKLGALSNDGPVDEDAAFERDLAERRQGPRGRATRPTTPRRTVRARSAAPTRVEPELPGAGATSRDLPTAIMTGLAVAVIAIICFTRGEGATVALAALIVGVATLELASSLQKRGLRPATLVALVASTLLPIAARHYGTAAYPVFFAMVVIVSMLWFLWEITPGRPLPAVASTVLVFAYVGGLGGFAGLILASTHGTGIILGVALCVIAYDVVGFFVGSQFGHTAIAPRVSPHKTVEGTVAGMFAAVVVGAVMGSQFSPWTAGKGAVLGVLVAAGAFVGDLCESMLKRDLGLKDFGSLLPGHGGVLDRFDALLFCLPIAYYLSLQFKIF
jgi:phosphatidate cytidylyltransferase